MATKRTLYLIGELSIEKPGTRDEIQRWNWISRDVHGYPWGWTPDRLMASRFMGRADARAFAEQCVTRMAANGYPNVELRLVPASGGLPTGEVIRHTEPAQPAEPMADGLLIVEQRSGHPMAAAIRAFRQGLAAEPPPNRVPYPTVRSFNNEDSSHAADSGHDTQRSS
jgi:hypothetical protein